ncbi:MAG TPA: hypothetical protein VJV96_08045 [Candidatus Angelobacter sp.]|nr:hypothetical protein [Candidatus Angelobacter sp.]
MSNAVEVGVKMTDPVVLANAFPRRSRLDSIVAGLAWLTRAFQDGQWIDSGLQGPFHLWVTACTLTRLGELPSQYITESLQAQIECAVNCLEKAALAGSGWPQIEFGAADAFTTAWAILALRSHRRAVPRAAIDFLLCCREPNGGFTAHPQNSAANGNGNGASAEITVTALRALSMCDRAGGDFVTSQLRNDISSTPAGKSARFYICSEILDWESGLAPWPLLNLVSQSGIQFDLGRSYEQALLLRMLSRLRNQRAWLAADSLKKMQLQDGSWPSCSATGQGLQNPVSPNCVSPNSESSNTVPAVASSVLAQPVVLSTVTAVSALAIHEAGPGCTDSTGCKQGALL